jgi:hypothetical protein
MEWNEENIEVFIKENKEKFNVYDPSVYHIDHFLLMLVNRFKKFISIVPYLIKVSIVTVIVFTISIWLWFSYVRYEKHVVKLKDKVENVFISSKK